MADEICERLTGGESLRSICRDDTMPPQSVVFQWLSKNESFAVQYARARQFWAETEFERMMEISDTVQIGEKVKVNSNGETETVTGDMTEHRKLQIDTRKWALARMSPKRYGDKLQHANQDGDGPPEFIVRSVLDANPSTK